MILDSQRASLEPSAASALNATVGGEASTKRAMDAKEQFLKMLVAQISNQSFENPMDDKDMVSQLAQFSSIEQAIETNSKLDALEHAQNVTSKLGVASLIGKQAAANTSHIAVGQYGLAGPIDFEIGARAKDVTVRIIDGENNLVRSINLQGMAPGSHTIPWDGKGLDKLPLPPGSYRADVQAVDDLGAEVAVRSEIRGIIHRVDVEGKEPGLFINDRRVALHEVSQITD